MNGRRFAPVLGIIGCLAVLAALGAPYLLVEGPGVGLYYDSGVVSPLIGGAFCVVSIVVFAAGRQDRTDPALAAGVALVFGVCVALVSIAWAFTVGLDVIRISPNHRWALALISLSVPLAGGWYARALGVF